MTMETTEVPLSGTRYLFSAPSETGDSKLHIELSPRPTHSPNDPLNWSLFRKIVHTSLVLFIVGFTAATSNDAGSAGDGMNTDLGISWGSLNTAAGVLFIGIGYATLLLSPTISLYGRRINYIICLLFSLVGAVWFAEVQTTQDSIWNQLFVGASESCAEAAAQLSLSDIWFQHQRGASMGLYILATSVGTFLGPLIGAIIADNVGWRWTGWTALIITCCTLVVFYFCFEETTFDRNHMLQGMDRAPAPEVLDANIEKEKIQDGDLQPDSKEGSERAAEKSLTYKPTIDSSLDKPKTYWQQIALITPNKNLRGTGFKQYFAILYHTMRIFTFPAVIYSGLQWGFQDAWLTFYLTVEEDNWILPPWNYGDTADGLMNIPTLIGAIIGCVYGGWLNDKFVIFMAKRNKGIAEAEHRLWFMYPAAVIGPAGLMLFGIGSGKGMPWPAPYVGLGLIGFMWGCVGDLSLTYLQDAYPEMILEGMVGVAVINNTLAMVFTFTADDWLNSAGISGGFVAVGVVALVVILLTIPMMYWGKATRRATADRYVKFVVMRDGHT